MLTGVVESNRTIKIGCFWQENEVQLDIFVTAFFIIFSGPTA
jgi:hypothetical protein